MTATIETAPPDYDVYGDDGTPFFDALLKHPDFADLELRAPVERPTLPYGLPILQNQVEVDEVLDRPGEVAAMAYQGLSRVVAMMDGHIGALRRFDTAVQVDAALLVPRIIDRQNGQWKLWFKNPKDVQLSGGMSAASQATRASVLQRRGGQVGEEAATLFGV